jgi:hypothetical protein
MRKIDRYKPQSHSLKAHHNPARPVWDAAFAVVGRREMEKQKILHYSSQFKEILNGIESQKNDCSPIGALELITQLKQQLKRCGTSFADLPEECLLRSAISKEVGATMWGRGTLSFFVLIVSLACLHASKVEAPQYLKELAARSQVHFWDTKFHAELPLKAANIVAKQFLDCLRDIDSYSKSRERLKTILRGVADSMVRHEQHCKDLRISVVWKQLTNPKLGDWQSRGNGVNAELKETIESMQALFKKVAKKSNLD